MAVVAVDRVDGLDGGIATLHCEIARILRLLRVEVAAEACRIVLKVPAIYCAPVTW